MPGWRLFFSFSKEEEKRGEKRTEREKNGKKGKREGMKRVRRKKQKGGDAPTAETASESLRTWPRNTSLILEASAPAPEVDAACLRSATVASSGEGSSTEKAAEATGLMVIFILV